MAANDLNFLPATELARRIRARQVSPLEAVRSSLARIEAVNPRLNAFCFVYPDEALAAARAAEAALERGAIAGPLHGVPIAIKDFTPTAGHTTTLGSRVYRDWVPEEDALIVRTLRAAGAIVVGKTTTPEFAHAGITRSPAWGVTRNPWNVARTPGGSSGGSAAAVAAGCVPLAEGSDMGGSVRIPASCCGIVGLKPSLGRIPFTVLPSTFDLISHFGPLARTIDDAALFLRVTQGPDEADILSNPNRLDLPAHIEGEVRGLRLAFSPDLGYYRIDPEVAANARNAATSLHQAGAEVEEVALAWSPEANDTWTQIWCVYLAAFFGQHLETWRERMDPAVVALMERGLAMSAVHYKRLEFVRTRLWHDLARLFARYDALLCPTTAIPPPAADVDESQFDGLDGRGRFLGFDLTSVFNLVSQCPALSVPSGFTKSGLPTGVQIVGRRFDDGGVLRIGAALEAGLEWSARRPPV